jgi:hypothetical protein
MRQVPRFTPDQSQLPIPGDQKRGHSTIGEAARR